VADASDSQPEQRHDPPESDPPESDLPESDLPESGPLESDLPESDPPESGPLDHGVDSASPLTHHPAVAHPPTAVTPGARLSVAGSAPEHPLQESLPVPHQPRRPPGPGPFEALLWTIGVPVVHLGAVLGMVLLLAVAGELMAVSLDIQDLIAPGQGLLVPVLLGGEMLVFVVVAVIAVVFRLGAQPGRKLALNGFCVPHALILIGLVLPLSVVSGELYRVTDTRFWQPLVEAFPLLSMLDNANAMESISSLAGQMPLVGLLLCLAVAPAIGEEVVCRGLIGRGLIARWGVPGGVACTTLLFAVIHLHPVHVVGVIPLGLCMHVLYVATRSFWAPVCYHFLNNAWACWMMSQPAAVEPQAAAGVSPTGLVLASGCILSLVGLLWQTRVRYILPDGGDWTPGYASLERPPVALGLRPSRRPCSAVWLLASLLTVAGFVYCL